MNTVFGARYNVSVVMRHPCVLVWVSSFWKLIDKKPVMNCKAAEICR